MNLSWAKISTLYFIALIQAGRIVELGVVYHDVSALALGFAGFAYFAARGAKALEMWYKGGRP